VPRGIKNAIYLDKKNGNNLWQEANKTELKQLTDYHTFIVLDSGEADPNGYQKIPYRILFDVKYDLRHEARVFGQRMKRKTFIQKLYEWMQSGLDFS
jgi:hypothetical protein